MARRMQRGGREGWRRHAAGVGRAALALMGLFGLSNVLHACLIEERTFDEHLANCSEYCDGAMDKCRGANAVYPSLEACKAVCEQMDPSDGADRGVNGNTLGCRLDRLRAPDFEVGSDCPAIGPGGNDVCGNNCEAFCSLRRAACGTLQPKEADILKPDYCELACSGLAHPADFDFETDRDSDTLQCRLVYLSEALAAPAAAEDNCDASRVLPQPGHPCWDGPETPKASDCETYCGAVMKSCTGKYQVYVDEAQCRRICDILPEGEPADTEANTVRCRRYHAFAAFGDPDYHCTHAGPTGDGHCGDIEQGNCESYCGILSVACPDRFAGAYGDQGASCITSCARAADSSPGEARRPALVDAWQNGFSDDPPAPGPRYTVGIAPSSATPLQCRTFHAVRALEEKSRTPQNLESADECAAAFADPGSPCQ
jgi:hypothetical protein